MMKGFSRVAAVLLLGGLFLPDLTWAAEPQPAASAATAVATASDRIVPLAASAPILAPWTGPYGGVPPWDRIAPEEFLPAFETAFAPARKEIDAIAEQPEPPTFKNTLAALEDAGRALNRLESLFGVYASNLNLGIIPEAEKVISPKMAEFRDGITQNEKLFARVAAVFEGKQDGLTPAEKRLLEKRYKSLHLAGDVDIDPDAFERDTLRALGMPEEIVMRHRTPQFSHVFAGDEYSAGYYSYLWADALTADAAEAFVEAGGFFEGKIAARLHDSVLSVGDTVDPADSFRSFRGRDVDTRAYLRKLGFPLN